MKVTKIKNRKINYINLMSSNRILKFWKNFLLISFIIIWITDIILIINISESVLTSLIVIIVNLLLNIVLAGISSTLLNIFIAKNNIFLQNMISESPDLDNLDEFGNNINSNQSK